MAPTELADLYDAPCYIKRYREKVERIGVCVDPTAKNIELAREKGIQILISHHRWLGEAAKTVEAEEISLYYMHSVWNRATEGTAVTLARLLNLEKFSLEGDVVKNTTDLTLKELIACCQRVLEVDILPYVGDLNTPVKKVVISAGPGFMGLYKEEWQSWLEEGFDTALSAELGRFAVGYLGSRGVNLVNLGHSPMVKPGMKHLAYLLQNRLKIFECEVEFLADLYTVQYQTGSFYHNIGSEEIVGGKEETEE